MTKLRSSLPAGRWVLSGLALLLLCAVAITPLLRSESPCTHDGAFHYYRVVAMRHALEEGLLFTRWLPDLAFGFGYPFFNYRAPLSYYLALGLYLTNLPLPLALDLVYVLSVLGCALGAYLLARDLFGARAGVVAAVAYAYAPYQFLDALLRANAPESLALALMPFVLWAFRRLTLRGGRWWFLSAAGSLAALYLTHNISSLIFTPLLLAYLALLAWTYRGRGRWGWVVLALGLALGLTAFLWLPALVEKGYVQLHMSRVTRNNDFHYNFLGLAEIFAPPAAVNTSLMNPPMEVHLGLVLALLAVAGLALGLIRLRGREERANLTFFAASAVVFIFMSTGASVWIWEHVPLLPFAQFPWRFVGRAALPAALLTGALFPSLRSSSAARRSSLLVALFLPLVVCLLIVTALPSTYPPLGYCPTAEYPTVEEIHRYEHESKLVGVDPEGSYFPVWVERRPEGSPLEEQYASGGTIARFDETSLPEDAAVLKADYGPNRARLVVESPHSFRARYLSFYFPGWKVLVDGEVTEVIPTDPEGLISFDVPAGRHTVIIRFGETRLRLAADVLSGLSLLSLLALTLRGPRSEPAAGCSSDSLRSGVGDSQLFAILAAFGVVLLVFKVAVVDRVETPFRHPSLEADGTLPGVTHPLAQRYADGLMLIGYDLSADRIPADGTLRVDLYWTAREQPSRRYQSVVHLVGPDGLLWSYQGSFRPRGYHRPPPTFTWGPEGYALDSHEVEPLPGAPPGDYRLVVTIFDRDTLTPLSVLDPTGQPAAPELTLEEVALSRPRRSASAPAEDRLDLSLGSLTLLTAEFDHSQAVSGESVLLTTLWRADQRPTQDLTLRLVLLGSDGSSAAEYDFPLGAPWYPTSVWQSGDAWRSQHRVRFPAALASGDYSWQLSVAPVGESADLPITIHIAAPDRTFIPPPVDVGVDTHLGSVATLVGFGLKPQTLRVQPGDSLIVTLVWRAEETASDSYHVFLHLLDPEGRLVAQSDGVPAGWTRPTTGWLPGEYVTDERVLAVPPDAPAGDYTLQTGLYLPNGERLTDPDGSDAVRLGTVTVEGR